MSNQLWSDLLIGSGQLWSDQDSAPGIISPTTGVVTLFGRDPIAAQNIQVFRTPATALLTLNGLSLNAPITLTPATAALAYGGQIPARELIRTISPALPAAVQNPPAAFVPTIITVWTTQPGVGSVVLQTLEINVTQGGNIGFVSPTTALVTLQTRQYSLLLLAGGAGVGALQINGLAPTIRRELTISPSSGALSMSLLAPDLSRPFTWVDDNPAPALSWITDAAA